MKLSASFLPTGNYEVSIKFNDEHIPESPYLVPIIAPTDDARRLTVTSLQVRHKETSHSLPQRLISSLFSETKVVVLSS